MSCPSGEGMAARGMLPSGVERPAGSRRAPVGRRATELGDADGSEGVALAAFDERLQPASARASDTSDAIAGLMIVPSSVAVPRPRPLIP